jgi:Rod binding domain-containing protein
VSTQLPPIDNSLLPADVRAGTKADQQRYKTALSFESEFVQQLTQQLADTTKASDTSSGDDDSDSTGDGSSAATDSYQQMLPGVLADSVMSAGGLGLARTIAQSMKDSGQ